MTSGSLQPPIFVLDDLRLAAGSYWRAFFDPHEDAVQSSHAVVYPERNRAVFAKSVGELHAIVERDPPSLVIVNLQAEIEDEVHLLESLLGDRPYYVHHGETAHDLTRKLSPAVQSRSIPFSRGALEDGEIPRYEAWQRLQASLGLETTPPSWEHAGALTHHLRKCFRSILNWGDPHYQEQDDPVVALQLFVEDFSKKLEGRDSSLREWAAETDRRCNDLLKELAGLVEPDEAIAFMSEATELCDLVADLAAGEAVDLGKMLELQRSFARKNPENLRKAGA